MFNMCHKAAGSKCAKMPLFAASRVIQNTTICYSKQHLSFQLQHPSMVSDACPSSTPSSSSSVSPSHSDLMEHPPPPPPPAPPSAASPSPPFLWGDDDDNGGDPVVVVRNDKLLTDNLIGHAAIIKSEHHHGGGFGGGGGGGAHSAAAVGSDGDSLPQSPMSSANGKNYVFKNVCHTRTLMWVGVWSAKNNFFPLSVFFVG